MDDRDSGVVVRLLSPTTWLVLVEELTSLLEWFAP